MTVDDKLAHLSLLASKLNAQSDALTESIAALNSKLESLKLGVSVWLKQTENSFHLLGRGEVIPGDDNIGWALGYAKVQDRWCLAAQRIQERHYQNEDDVWGTVYEPLDGAMPVSLLKAPRVIRVEAAGLFEELLAKIVERVEKYIQNVDQARELTKDDAFKVN